ncbi:hypothetical protein D5S18_21010 [Nocardia panacis]|uniref:Uncharacterized protein n=1 Tax=Nocardia panacis TaxID=2340916 RepID=A0A3A4K800_9NOCA|nr:hypothetical protein [Nocardia panacis]RJO73662.1 hypothetical protein D5S18_21010 [Nocardia panacis]
MFGTRVSRMRWRSEAGRLVTVMAVGFGLTVVITRLYLMASGYPKIGGNTYHIAHALFGGLLLVIACLMMLLLIGRTALTTAAVLSGVGLGLFIDEVGKFITADNNYFFPLAAPIIYLAFLLIVLVARYAARTRKRPPALVLAEITEQVGDQVGARIGPQRRDQLLDQLNRLDRRTFGPEMVELCTALTDYLKAAHEDTRPALMTRVVRAATRVEAALLPLPLLRALLIAVMFAHAIWTLLRLVLAVVVMAGWHTPWRELDHLLDPSQNHGWKSLVGLGIAAVAQVVVALGYGAAAVLWTRGRTELGVRLGIWSSLVSLTVVNVLASYFSQFLTVFTAIAEALLLWMLIRFRTRYYAAVGE